MKKLEKEKEKKEKYESYNKLGEELAQARAKIQTLKETSQGDVTTKAKL